MIYLSIFTFFLSFGATYYVLPHSIRKLKENGYVAKDMYKSDSPEIATNAGIIVLFISYLTISLIPFVSRFLSFISIEGESFFDLNKTNMAFLLVISIYALYGLVDDLVDIGRKLKLFLPVAFSFPLITVVSPDSIWIPTVGDFQLNAEIYQEITYNDLFRITIIPIYVMVVSNLVNMHSGYNGLQSGLSIIIMLTIFTKLIISSSTQMIPILSTFIGSIMAFWWFNFYPAKVFEGNIGSLLFGSIIGSIIVIENLWWFGFFILIPHSFNFILWVYWLLMMRIEPSKYLKINGKHKKFGNIREDNTIEVPNYLTLKWIPNYFFDINEKMSTYLMYFLTILFSITGLLLF